jgi:hypothetical protein
MHTADFYDRVTRRWVGTLRPSWQPNPSLDCCDVSNRPSMDDVLTQEVIMTAEEFAEAIDELIAAAREGGLSDAPIIVVLEDAVEGLE